MDIKHNFFSALLVLLLAGSQPLSAEEAADNQPSLMRTEAIAGLYYGMTKAAAFKYLAVKPTLGEMIYWGDDGAMHQYADFATAGVELYLVSDTETSPQTVESIAVEAPSTLSTKKGIHIGSSEAEVVAAYKGLSDKDFTEPGKVFVAGSIYGGLLFTIEQGKVVRMYIGASAD